MPHQGIESDPASEDEARERSVLMAVLEVHPGQITKAELIREYADDPEDFSSRDGFDRAIQDLAKVGLLHCCGEFIVPTRAAVQIKKLWGIVG